MPLPHGLMAQAQRIRLLLLDVDGVLTDGSILLDNAGNEIKRFHVRDGSAIKLWRSAGHQVGIVSGRASQATARRAAELGIAMVEQGVSDKIGVVESMLEKLGLEWDAVCFVGDDLPDRPVVERAGLGVSVADGVEELREIADFVTEARGGQMAVREVIRGVLIAQNRWADLVSTVGAQRAG